MEMKAKKRNHAPRTNRELSERLSAAFDYFSIKAVDMHCTIMKIKMSTYFLLFY